jgi:hypothetical protein
MLMTMLKILARVLGLGIRVIEGYGGTVLYGITPTLHTHIIQEALPYKSGTKPYKKKKVS